MIALLSQHKPFVEMNKIYLVQLLNTKIPDTAHKFQDVAGGGGYGVNKTFARCQSIRRKIFDDNNDRIGQVIGFTIGNLRR